MARIERRRPAAERTTLSDGWSNGASLWRAIIACTHDRKTLGTAARPDDGVAARLRAAVSGAACSSAVWTSHFAIMTLKTPRFASRASATSGYSNVRCSPGGRALTSVAC